jgi:hypothetical protein
VKEPVVKAILLCLFATTLTACGEPKKPERTVWDDQLRAIEKAKKVQGHVNDAAKRTEQAVETEQQKQGGGGY